MATKARAIRKPKRAVAVVKPVASSVRAYAAAAPAPRAPSAPKASTKTVQAASSSVPQAPAMTDFSPEAILQANPLDSPTTVATVGYGLGEYQRIMGPMGERNNSRNQLASNYGFRFTPEDAANGRSFVLDFETNPYSKAALLKRQWTQQKSATTGQQASSGLIYDGSTQQAMMNDDFNEGSDYATLTSNFSTGLGDIDRSAQTSIGTIIKSILEARGSDAEIRARQTTPVAEDIAKPAAVVKGPGWTSAKPWSPANPKPLAHMTAADKKAYNKWLLKNANQKGVEMTAAYPKGF